MLPVLRTRNEYINFVEVLYFGAIQAGAPEKVLAWFAPGAVLTGYGGDDPPRIMTRTPGPGQLSLDAFMSAANSFDLTYGNFVHYVDTEAARVASHFSLVMRPKAAGTVPTRHMRNCNFFQFQDNRLIAVTAYFSNPAIASAP